MQTSSKNPTQATEEFKLWYFCHCFFLVVVFDDDIIWWSIISLSFQAHLNSQSSSLVLMPLSSCSVSCHILFYLNYINSLGQGLSLYLENVASRYSAA